MNVITFFNLISSHSGDAVCCYYETLISKHIKKMYTEQESFFIAQLAIATGFVLQMCFVDYDFDKNSGEKKVKIMLHHTRHEVHVANIDYVK